MNNVVVIEINNASSSLYSAVDKAENCEPNEYQSEFDQNNNEYAVDYAHNEIATAGDNEEDDYISSTPQNQGIPPNATIEVTPTIKREVIHLDERFVYIDTSSVVAKSNIFHNMEFCIMIHLGTHYDRKVIEPAIVAAGGTTVLHPNANTIIVATQELSRFQSFKKKNSNHIVKIEWLVKCLAENEFYLLKPSDMFHIKKA